MPDDLTPVAFHRGGLVAGGFSDPERLDPYWIHSRGGKKFLSDRLGEKPFFGAGIHDRGGSAYLFVMWSQGNRKFWFYDQYAIFVAESSKSQEATGRQFDEALERWSRSNGDVVFSGPWGGLFDTTSNLFPRDVQVTAEAWEGNRSAGFEQMLERLRQLVEPK